MFIYEYYQSQDWYSMIMAMISKALQTNVSFAYLINQVAYSSSVVDLLLINPEADKSMAIRGGFRASYDRIQVANIPYKSFIEKLPCHQDLLTFNRYRIYNEYRQKHLNKIKAQKLKPNEKQQANVANDNELIADVDTVPSIEDGILPMSLKMEQSIIKNIDINNLIPMQTSIGVIKTNTSNPFDYHQPGLGAPTPGMDAKLDALNITISTPQTNFNNNQTNAKINNNNQNNNLRHEYKSAILVNVKSWDMQQLVLKGQWDQKYIADMALVMNLQDGFPYPFNYQNNEDIWLNNKAERTLQEFHWYLGWFKLQIAIADEIAQLSGCPMPSINSSRWADSVNQRISHIFESGILYAADDKDDNNKIFHDDMNIPEKPVVFTLDRDWHNESNQEKLEKKRAVSSKLFNSIVKYNHDYIMVTRKSKLKLIKKTNKNTKMEVNDSENDDESSDDNIDDKDNNDDPKQNQQLIDTILSANIFDKIFDIQKLLMDMLMPRNSAETKSMEDARNDPKNDYSWQRIEKMIEVINPFVPLHRAFLLKLV